LILKIPARYYVRRDRWVKNNEEQNDPAKLENP
jgi:hypothetical protein